MSLYKQKDSQYWWISIYSDTGKRIRVSSGTTNEQEALAIEATLKMAYKGNKTRSKLIEQLDMLLGTEDVEHGVLLSKAGDKYEKLPDLGVKSKTIRDNKSCVDKFAAWCSVYYPSIKYMHEVSRVCALAYSDFLRGETNKNKTYNNKIGNIKTVFKKLMIHSGCKENVWTLIQLLSTKDSLHGRAFSHEEEERILDECKKVSGQWYEASLIAKYTGLRQIDIVNLHWDDIDGDIIKIVPSKTTRHDITVVMPIHDNIKWIFAGQKKKGKVLKNFIGAERESDFSKILKKANVVDSDHYISFHCWRHTFRTNLSTEGVDKSIAQRLGGWTTDISEKIYNQGVESLKAAITLLK